MNRSESPPPRGPDEQASAEQPDLGDAVALAKPLSRAQVRAIFVAILMAMFLGALNQTVVATALPTIGRDFDDFANLSWVVTAYLLTSTTVAPLFGKLSDIHGRRGMMLAGIGLFVAGSVISAVAPNMLILVAGRALQGIGGGGIMPLAQTIIADIIAARERGRYQAYIGIVWVTSGLGGPVIGGYLSEHFHWSLVFWINVPIGLAAAALVQVTLRHFPRRLRSHRLDFIGAALMVAAAMTLLLALTWGGTRYSWASAPIVVLIVLASALTAAFTWRLRMAPEPFLPLRLLTNPVVRTGTTASACAVATPLGLTIFLPLYFEVVHQLSASDSGLALIPIAAFSTPGSVLSARTMMFRRHYKWVPTIGLSCALVCLAGLAAWPAAPLWVVLVAMSIISSGCGSLYPVATVCIQNAVDRHDVGTATGVMNFFRGLASAFLVAAMGAVILAGFGVTPQRGTGVEVLAATALATGADFSPVFRWVFVAGFACLALGLLALVRMEERPLPGPRPAA